MNKTMIVTDNLGSGGWNESYDTQDNTNIKNRGTHKYDCLFFKSSQKLMSKNPARGHKVEKTPSGRKGRTTVIVIVLTIPRENGNGTKVLGQASIPKKRTKEKKQKQRIGHRQLLGKNN